MDKTQAQQQREALESAGISGMGARLFMGFIRILIKKAGPALLNNGKTGIAIVAFVDANGAMKPTMTLYGKDGTKTAINIGDYDMDEAEEEALKELEERNNGTN